jgi:hypothetical protein
MSVMMVRQKLKDDSVEEAEAAVRELFATLDRLRPAGLRYASTRVADTSTFVILIELADGLQDPARRSPSSGGSWSSSRAGWTDRRWSSASTSSAPTACSEPGARHPRSTGRAIWARVARPAISPMPSPRG